LSCFVNFFNFLNFFNFHVFCSLISPGASQSGTAQGASTPAQEKEERGRQQF
jgi:hypothetical protein